MDDLFSVAQKEIQLTTELMKNFFKGVDIASVLFVLAVISVIFLKRLNFWRLISFLSTLFITFIVLLRLENFFLLTLSKEGAQTSIGISRVVFFIIAALMLIYNLAIKE